MSALDINFFIPSDKTLGIIYAFCLLLIGFFFAKRLSLIAERAFVKRFSRHQALLVKRSIFYLVLIVFIITGLQHLGFKLSVLLGAAGVFTVAISFASQTAASNLISGIFLLFEHPFKIGDTVEVKGIQGVVESIDLLSTKLKTADNKLVRIPNEAMIKSEITNLSYFSTRRIEIPVTIAYACDIAEVKSLLVTLANNSDAVLKDPAPNVIIENFANYGIELKLMVWVKTTEVTAIRSTLQESIKTAFEKKGIENPLPPSFMMQGLNTNDYSIVSHR